MYRIIGICVHKCHHTQDYKTISFGFCGVRIFSQFVVKRYLTKRSRITLDFLKTTNVTISEVSMNNSNGAGLLGINMFGISNISQTVLSSNRPNCLIVFQEFFKLNVIPPTRLNIANSHLMFGKIPSQFQMYRKWGATGLGIFLALTP